MRGLLVIAALYALTSVLRSGPGGGSWNGGSTPDPDATVRLNINGTPAASLSDATVQLRAHIDKVKAKQPATANNLGADPATTSPASPAGGIVRVPLEVKRASEPEWIPGSGEPCPPFLSGITAGTSPEMWVDLINGEGIHGPGRSTNCIDCARAVEQTWRGNGVMAAAMGDSFTTGTGSVRVYEWTPGNIYEPSYGQIDEALTNLGANSSAIITSEWTSGGAHTYNALNDDGVNKFVDGQDATVSVWPPSNWSEDQVVRNLVFFYDPTGKNA